MKGHFVPLQLQGALCLFPVPAILIQGFLSQMNDQSVSFKCTTQRPIAHVTNISSHSLPQSADCCNIQLV